ncbi:hypothetical protein NE237_000225 [Protea cynaroides]|uniref:THIF-type NAD/FAD binding fold domain-containing protein n=1 Tax=Protea cynaroides TaxID=273540 RepID=A0A9Q0QXA2_9MAGN|nr:hypothetical protein NE237_000225 [Protea cynaroides]
MDSSGGDASRILAEIKKLKLEKSEIEHWISVLQARFVELNKTGKEEEIASSCSYPALISSAGFGHGLSPDMIYRYSRHLLLSSFGVQGQSSLLSSSFLELLVLIIHTEAFIGQSKVESAAAACCAINSTVQIEEHKEALRTSNALEIVSKYDIVIDATDNVPSRYMISDCCVVLGKLTVYNHNGGSCYRCLFPMPPPTRACQSCPDSGLLGVVPGIIGCLQALEAMKVATAIGEPL